MNIQEDQHGRYQMAGDHRQYHPDQLDQVSAKLTAAGMDGLVIEDEGDFLQFLEQNRQYWDYVDQELLDPDEGSHPDQILCHG